MFLGEGVIDYVVFLFVAIKGVKIYRTHWIKYGGGKVIIRRISKDRVNGKPTGKYLCGKHMGAMEWEEMSLPGQDTFL